MEIALCIIVAAYFAFAFSDVQSVIYIAAVAYVLHMFINNPRLFSNGSNGSATTNDTVHIDQQASVTPLSANPLHELEQPSPKAATLVTQNPMTSPTPKPASPIRSSQPAPRAARRMPSRYSFDPVNGGVVHSPTLVPTSSAPTSPSGSRPRHRVPDVSAGKSPILPFLSASPVSYLPNEHPELPVAHGEVLNQIVHTEMVTTPRLSVQLNKAIAAEKSPHRRIGSHHHRHHHSHSRSHYRQRSSRSPMSFSDSTATGSGDHDCDSDSSHASTSSTRSTTSSRISYGLPSYEQHVRCRRHRPFVCLFRTIKKNTSADISVHQYTMILTLSPKRAGYLPQIQSIIKAVRPYWLSLPGSVSHEVGHDSQAGTVVIVETCTSGTASISMADSLLVPVLDESKDDVVTFEQSKEREKMLARIKPFIDESKTTVIRLPACSAATRYR